MSPRAKWKEFDSADMVENVSNTAVDLATYLSGVADEFLSSDSSEWPDFWTVDMARTTRRRIFSALQNMHSMVSFFVKGPDFQGVGAPFFPPGKRVPSDRTPAELRNEVGLQTFGSTFHQVRQAVVKLGRMASAAGWTPRWEDGDDASDAPSAGDPLYSVYGGFFVISKEFLVFRLLSELAMSQTAARRLARDVEFLDLVADLMLILRPAVDAGLILVSRRRRNDEPVVGPKEVALHYALFADTLRRMFLQTPEKWADHSRKLAQEGLPTPAYHLLEGLRAFHDSLPLRLRYDQAGKHLQENLESLEKGLEGGKVLKCPCCGNNRLVGKTRGERCDECGKPAGPGVQLRRCKRCLTAVYCGIDCQKRAWAGGHRDVCSAVKQAEAAGGSADAAE
ncbi:hypothetical protein DFJ74DRAFT_676130 [Hyaloraphidium curvatum]|nr:hypothetical protein DFJ74DRAFT_676130 [Hyaloraphidium curvatum]